MKNFYITYFTDRTVEIDGQLYNGRRKILLGYAGENDAATFKIAMPNDLDGYSFYPLFDDEVHTDVTPYTDVDIEHDIESTYMTKGIHAFRLEARYDDDIIIFPKIYFNVK